MRGLRGDLSTMPLADLVVYLGNRAASGVLRFERGGTRKEAVLREGKVVNASSNEPREYLGRFLVNLGHITEDQFEKAYQTQRETKVYLGKILVMTGAVTEDTVFAALKLKARETVLDAFNWTEGTFHYDPDATAELPDGLELSVGLLDLHREGDFRVTAWRAIRAAFPSGDLRLALEEENLPERPRPGSFDDRLFRLIREGRTIEEIARELSSTDFYLYQRLYALSRLDAVRAEPVGDEPLAPATAAQEPPLAELLTRAEGFLAGARFDEAEELARRAHELAPTPQTAALLARAEAQLVESLRERLCAPGTVARLDLPPAAVKSMPLSAAERYLLSRVEGGRGVAAVVQVSPLPELDALKHFRRFVDLGLIRIELA